MSDAAHGGLRPAAPPLVPEVLIRQAAESTGLWELAGGGYRSDEPPPFWAFPWAGGQALARYVLDHREAVSGRRVLDLAAGSGLVGIAAALAGAASVRAVDSDPAAIAAVAVNAGLNGVAVTGWAGDPLDGDAGPADLVLAGDVFYSQAMAARVLRFVRRAADGGARVLVGDAHRGFLPARLFHDLGGYDVPVPPALEDTRLRRATVYELRSRAGAN
ncbi:MAG TPA: 50S ribosomal protein L11 methyltransferase [Catenuloplanes sp.]